MDTIVEKVGLYDILGVFLSGMFFVVFSLLLNVPLNRVIEITDNDSINVFIFILLGIFSGIILQEISSVIDKKLFKFREKARVNFLNYNNAVFNNDLELRSYRKLANKILRLNKNSTYIYSHYENEYVFFYCKTYLETHGAGNKINLINALYAMSRSFILSIPLCTVLYLRCNTISSDSCEFITILIFCSLLTWLFYNRTKRYAFYRVRVLLRYYKTIKESHPESHP